MYTSEQKSLSQFYPKQSKNGKIHPRNSPPAAACGRDKLTCGCELGHDKSLDSKITIEIEVFNLVRDIVIRTGD